MIVTFCGHSDYYAKEGDQRILLELLEEQVGDQPAEMFLGNYGRFDHFAYQCCKKYKETHPNVRLVFVTPYMTEAYQKKHLAYEASFFDRIIYPELERVPLRFAITHRNRYMVEQADLVIAYIAWDLGGAYQSYQYAKRKGKPLFNLAELR